MEILLSTMASIFNQNILQVPVCAINYVLVLHDKKDHVFCSSTIILAIKVAVSCNTAKIMNWIKSILHIFISEPSEQHLRHNIQVNGRLRTEKKNWFPDEWLFQYSYKCILKTRQVLERSETGDKVPAMLLFTVKKMFSQISHTRFRAYTLVFFSKQKKNINLLSSSYQQ